MTEKKLYRSRKDKRVAGVCGGIAEYFGVDSTLIRLAWLISILFAFTGLLLYIACVIVIPENPYDLI